MHHQPPPFPLPPSSSPPSTPTTTTSPSPPLEDLEEQSTTADDGICESQEILYYGSFPSLSVAATAAPRQRRRYDPAERQVVKAVRALGACRRCHQKRVQCQHARELLKYMLESKGNAGANDVQVPSNHMSTQYSSLANSTDSGYPSSGDRKTLLHGWTTDMSSGGNPVTWHLRTLSPSQTDEEDVSLDEAQPRTELWSVGSEGQLLPPQDDLASYMPIATKELTQQRDEPLYPFFTPSHYSLQFGSMQQNYDDSSKLSATFDGFPLRKDLASCFPTVDEPPLQVHYGHVLLPGEGVPFRVGSGIHSVQPERARPAAVSARRNSTNRVQRPRRRGRNPSNGRQRPQVPLLVTENSLASTASEAPSGRSMDLSSPLDHLSLQNVPEQQTSPPAQNNWRPVPTIRDQISSSNFIPQVFSPPNQPQYASMPSLIPSLGLNPSHHESNMSPPPFDYQTMQQQQQQPARQYIMRYDHTYGNLTANDMNAGYFGMNDPQVNHMQENYPQMTHVYGQPTQYNPAWVDNYAPVQSSNVWSTPPHINSTSANISSGPPSLATNTTGSSHPVPSPPDINAQQPSAYFPPSNDSLFEGLEPPSIGQGYGSTWQDSQAMENKADEMTMEFLALP